jgi:uncharacterized protein YcbX
MSIGQVTELWRFPVKSMLGQRVEAAGLGEAGLDGDRGYAVLDVETGKIASPKRPQLWRRMLELAAESGVNGATVRFPDGATFVAGDAELDERLSAFLGRRVRMLTTRQEQRSVDRSLPEQVLAVGDDASAEYTDLPLAQAAPAGGFFDFAPFHVMTRTSLEAIRDAAGDDSIVAERYRPNIVVDCPSLPPFAENGWTGATMRIGPDAALKFVLPTPRCAIPMLPQGALGRSPGALTSVLELNRIELPDFAPGLYPCLGAFAVPAEPGRVASGDAVTFVSG